MKEILLPSIINVQEGGKPNQGIIEISPCYFGYGTTLGNALRRVLLSSLPGAAVTAVKIKGVQHEFSTIKHVAEDTLEILLNFKRLRLKIFSDSDEPIRLHLKVKGKKEVKAGDIEKNSEVEIVNPDLHLATITDKDGELDVEIFVEKGRGYLSIEEQRKRNKNNAEIGVITLDAIFSPIKKVGYKVENVRVGEITDYDKLILNIETDGTMTPVEAVEQASQILIDYFSLLTDLKKFDKKSKKNTK